MNATSTVHNLRPQLLERRARLTAAATSVSAEYLNDLLAEVDAALQRVDAGSFGICESCHETIEADRLQVNPLVRFCLDHLSGSELRAHQQDLDLATEIQSKLLPPCDISLEHCDTHYPYEPAGPVAVDHCEPPYRADPAGLGGGAFGELVVPEDRPSFFFAVGAVGGEGRGCALADDASQRDPS